jgi:hypothetical protein
VEGEFSVRSGRGGYNRVSKEVNSRDHMQDTSQSNVGSAVKSAAPSGNQTAGRRIANQIKILVLIPLEKF